MTAIGINITDREAPATWADLKAKSVHHNAAVDEAKAAMTEAWLEHDRATEAPAINLQHINALRIAANEAERRYMDAWRVWQSELYDKLQEAYDQACTCRDLPDGRVEVCPTCKERAHASVLPY